MFNKATEYFCKIFQSNINKRFYYLFYNQKILNEFLEESLMVLKSNFEFLNVIDFKSKYSK